VAFVASIPLLAVVVGVGRTGAARAAGGVYAVCLVGLFGVSAAYHRIPWSARALIRMKRLDHSMIYVFIAATYTPISALVLHGAWSVTILAGVWALALTGVVLQMTAPERTRLVSGALYIVLGWFAVVALPQIVRGLSVAELTLMFAGGLMYTGGAIVLATRRPNPRPAVFGYHEIWHSLTIAASLCHYALIILIVSSAR
jgi:hemolysin III